jgi:TolB protein
MLLIRRQLFVAFLAAASALAQSGSLGPFTDSGDVGGPAIKGSTAFDAAKGEFRITGAGANVWAKEDQFQYVWREMSGNLAVTATMQFLGTGADHRKAGIMLRHSLETDSPYIDIVIHGNGMPGIQWRNTKGDITNAMDFPFDGPAKYKLKLVRQGNAVTVSIGKDGAGLKELGHTQAPLGNPVLVGLAVCSHKADASDTVVFSDVSVEQLAPPAGKKQ